MPTKTIPEPRLKDIAEMAGVSVSSVSKVLNNREGVGAKTREHVLKIMEECGYIGRSGRLNRDVTLSILTLEQYVTNDAFYGDILSGINNTATQAGIDVSVRVFSSTEEMARSLALPSIDGPLLLVGVDHPDVIEAICSRGLPAVIANGMDRSMRLSSVSPDYHFGAWQATQHLMDLGHRNIVHVTHPYRESLRRRIDGFRNAIEEHGIDYNPSRHVLDLGSPANISIASRDIILDYLTENDNPPTAYFCVNDMVALGVIQALQTLHLSVPHDVSVIGFDGLSIGTYSTPQLSSVQSDRAALGRIGVELLKQKISNPASTVQRVTVGVELIVRRSTAAARV